VTRRMSRALQALACPRPGLRGPLAALATVVGLRLCFPPYDLFPLAFLVPVPMIAYVVRSRARPAMLWALAGGWGAMLLLVYWLHHVTWLGWVLLALYLGAYVVGFAALLRLLERRWSAPLVLLVPVVWTAVEYARGTLLTGFPWFLMGHTQYRNLPFIQVADLMGAYGVSSLLMTVPGAIVDVLFQRRRRWLGLGAALAAVAGAHVYGLVRLAMYDPVDGPRVCLVQANVPIDLKHSPEREEVLAFVRKHARLSRGQTAQAADLIVWPETMVPVDLSAVERLKNVPEFTEEMARLLAFLRQRARDRELSADEVRTLRQLLELESVDYLRRLDGLARETAQHTGKHLVVGALGSEAGGEKTYNSAYFIAPDGTVLRRYDKRHLVVFGEYTPLADVLPFLRRFRPPQMGEDLSPGRDPALFDFPYGGRTLRLGATICYEDTVPEVVRESVKAGADALVNLSNDGWFKDSPEMDQHLAIAVFRSVETRRPMVRASNTGISSFVEATGRIQARLERDGHFREVEGVLAERVRLSNLEGLYVRTGDLFALLCTAATVLLGIGAFLRRRPPSQRHEAAARGD